MQPPLGEVLFEFGRLGNVVKVTAIHVATDTEICLVGAPGGGRAHAEDRRDQQAGLCAGQAAGLGSRGPRTSRHGRPG